MNPFHIHAPWFIICCVLVVLLFLQRELGGNHITNNHTHNYYDSTQKEIDVRYISGPIQTIQTTIPTVVDTMAILRAYFEKNVYKQVIGDSNMTAEITSVVFKNKLDSLGFKYKITRPIAVIEQPKTKIFAGITGGASKAGIASFGPEVSLLTTKDHLYSASYNTINNSVNVSVLWKIRFKR
jgi:hypothetical protein